MTDVNKLITDNIDVWTSAIKKRNSQGRGSNSKIELTGIKKLRELILELAVRGKLVPQDPNDEPASVLLKKIAEEKAQLIADKKIKKQKALPEITDEEKIPELPVSWKICRFGSLGVITSSSRVNKKDWQTDGVPFYRAREIVQLAKTNKAIEDLFISEELYSKLSTEGTSPETNDIMVTGVGTIGVPYVVKPTDKFYFKDASVLIFKNYFNFDCDYLTLFLTSPIWNKSIHSKSMGTTVHTLTIVRANETVITVPPLAEQHRIVAKVDELMALCDQLEQQTEQNLTSHQTLVEALLNTLTQSVNADDFQESWQRIADHFDVLFTTEASIVQLKQTILQLAVMGKLVPQNPNDESASKLLEKIAEEKAQLIKDKKIRKQKEMISISDLELPFKVPNHWSWSRLGDLCQTVADGPHFSPKYVEASEGVIFLSTRNISSSSIDLSTAKYVSKEDHESFCKRVRVKKGDVLYTKGGTTGIAKVNDLDIEFSVWVHLAVLQIPNDKLHNEFIAMSLNSPHCYKQSQIYTNGIGNKDLGLTRMINITLPLPPLAEQHRIVAKVDELMTLCDQLKTRLADAQTTQLHLADAVVENALN